MKKLLILMTFALNGSLVKAMEKEKKPIVWQTEEEAKNSFYNQCHDIISKDNKDSKNKNKFSILNEDEYFPPEEAKNNCSKKFESNNYLVVLNNEKVANGINQAKNCQKLVAIIRTNNQGLTQVNFRPECNIISGSLHTDSPNFYKEAWQKYYDHNANSKNIACRTTLYCCSTLYYPLMKWLGLKRQRYQKYTLLGLIDKPLGTISNNRFTYNKLFATDPVINEVKYIPILDTKTKQPVIEWNPRGMIVWGIGLAYLGFNYLKYLANNK